MHGSRYWGCRGGGGDMYWEGLVSPLNRMAGLAFIMEGLLCIGGRCACRVKGLGLFRV